MIAVYILILCLSAGVASWVGLRLWTQFGGVLGASSTTLGACILLPAIAFLIVVAAPPSVLFFACVLLGAGKLLPTILLHRMRYTILLGISVLGSVLFQHPLLADYFRAFPYTAVMAVGALLWFAVTYAISTSATSIGHQALVSLFSCLPLAFVPLYVGHYSPIALDAAILASAWCGSVFAAKPWQMVGQSATIAGNYILCYLMLAALLQGAWPLALASAVIAIAGGIYAQQKTVNYALEAATRA